MPRRRRPPRPGAMAELPPLRIAAQIVTLQTLYYICAIVLTLFTGLVSGTPFRFDLVFGWNSVRGDTTQGWLRAFILVFNGGFCMAIAIILLVSRSKLVPDFALTVHGLHLVTVIIYTSHIPRSAMWWMSMFVSSGVCVTLGIWVSQRRELKPIFFGGSGGSNGASGNAPANGPHVGDEEAGLPNGRARGRLRDGPGGEYEMVGMRVD